MFLKIEHLWNGGCFFRESIHKSEELTVAVLTVINSFNIDISYLRGQTYDNAMNTSSTYN